MRTAVRRTLATHACRRQFATPMLQKGSVPPAPVVPVQVQGRAFLPCSENPKLPKALDGPRDSFPYVLEPQSSAQDFSIQDWANACKMEMDENLAKYGAILFRGLPLSTPDDFGKWMRGLDWRTMGDKEALKCMFARSMSSHNINEMVRTASDDPAEYTIEPHSEYHTVGFPDKIFLWCEQPATHGGEWPCTDIRAVYRDLDPEVTKKFEELGVNYKVSYPCREKAHYNNWEDNISPDKEFVEHYLADQGYTWKWGDDNSLTYEQVFPVTKTHPKTGEKAWFNQIHAQHMTFYTNHPLFVNKPKTDTEGWPVDCSYGDGTPIPPAILDHIRETVWKHTIALGQEPGDLLVCDNLLVMHGRMGYSPAGSRKVYASVSYE
mmetsp:Transcript_60082/g.99173  ORF Transcript_60082/g.99173 Transcript_60082/m.99173 type:complete len:378 (-) Transcript_60082:727-1860(-)|eukprot:CAMPEP_0174283642 /NCGR_PEP_ID=MMETSP0809-20121228/4358_1 /TAXON_ID=73025 ORGANISM="Eutreptiella gymnastica-like, Strain CCMP1594" /NCGR_SAMPLE_ID=MMETSP0809 /ASSEMBLY_ACC=CAM_ASM_000658 /LENGTH=377 /DNA_ID=CAMNT_0015378703 /DNA_START=28 /DNA_END=1161 /DNA_ORIENTATION=-